MYHWQIWWINIYSTIQSEYTNKEISTTEQTLIDEGLALNEDTWEYEETEKTECIKLSKKSNEVEQLIVSKYSITDQLNILARWTQQEKDDMNAYIWWILTEYKTNWVNANFEQFLSPII
jgi:hypothetical protein